MHLFATLTARAQELRLAVFSHTKSVSQTQSQAATLSPVKVQGGLFWVPRCASTRSRFRRGGCMIPELTMDTHTQKASGFTGGFF